MRNLALLALVLAISPALAADLSLDQARALANKDQASMNVDQMAALADSQNKASSNALAKCPQPTRKAELAPVVIVMELDATGKVSRSWMENDSVVARCISDSMTHATYAKPPHAPFYATFDLNFQQ